MRAEVVPLVQEQVALPWRDLYLKEASPEQKQVTGAGYSDVQLSNAAIRARLVQQKRAVSLLLVGSLCTFAGIVITSSVGMQKYFYGLQFNYLGEPFPSGHAYTPNTVSELVHNSESPQAKAFFAFTIVASACLLIGWYPWELRNVYTGDNTQLCCCMGPAMTSIRHYLPPIGMLMVASIPVVARCNRGHTDNTAALVHNMGAQLSMGGYGVAELWLLVWAVGRTPVVVKPTERILRIVAILISLSFAVGFLVLDDYTGSFEAWGCDDVWRTPTADEVRQLQGTIRTEYLAVQASEALRTKKRLLYNSATGKCLKYKAAEFWCEVLAGFFMVVDMWVIWWYAAERYIDLDDSLPGLYDDQRPQPTGDEGGNSVKTPDSTWYSC